MQIKKGKVLFGFKDTFNMQDKLSEVILAGLLKYKDVINEEANRKGIPASISCHLESVGEISYEDDYNLSEESWDKCYKYFDYVLDEMIYAFSDNEPDTMDYDFKIDVICDVPDKETGCVPAEFVCSNEEESKRHIDDMKTYNARCDLGRELFAKHFNGLWW